MKRRVVEAAISALGPKPYDYKAGLSEIAKNEAASKAPVDGLYTIGGLTDHIKASQEMGSDLEKSRAIMNLSQQPEDPYAYLKRQ